jgi:hypothetical protein
MKDIIYFQVRVFLVITFLLSPNVVFAENIGRDFISTNGSFFRLLNSEQSDFVASYLYQPSNDQKNGPGEFDLQKFSGKLEIPVPISRDFYYRVGGEYGASIYDFKQIPDVGISVGSETLHKTVLHIGAGNFFTRDLLLTAVVSPSLYSDFSGSIKQRDFQLNGEAMLVYRLNPTAQLLGGMVIGENFDSMRYLPVAGIRLLSENGKIHIRITAPLEARVGYNLTPSTELYGGFWISGEKYHVRFGEDIKSFNVQVHNRRAGIGTILWFNNHVNLQLEGGLTVGSELEFKVDNAGQFDGDLKKSAYLSAQIGIAL